MLSELKRRVFNAKTLDTLTKIEKKALEVLDTIDFGILQDAINFRKVKINS